MTAQLREGLNANLEIIFSGKNYGVGEDFQVYRLLDTMAKYPDSKELCTCLTLRTMKGVSKIASLIMIDKTDLTEFGCMRPEFSREQLQWLYDLNSAAIKELNARHILEVGLSKMRFHLYGHQGNVLEEMAEIEPDKEKCIKLLRESIRDYDCAISPDDDEEYTLAHFGRRYRIVAQIAYLSENKDVESLQEAHAGLTDKMKSAGIDNPKTLFFIYESLAKISLELAEATEENEWYEKCKGYVDTCRTILEKSNWKKERVRRLITLLANRSFKCNRNQALNLEKESQIFGTDNDESVLELLILASEDGELIVRMDNSPIVIPTIPFLASVIKKIADYSPEKRCEWLRKSLEHEVLGAEAVRKKDPNHSAISFGNAGITAARLYELTHDPEMKKVAIQYLETYLRYKGDNLEATDGFNYLVLSKRRELSDRNSVRLTKKGLFKSGKPRKPKKDKRKISSRRRIKAAPNVDWDFLEEETGRRLQ